MGVFIDCNGHVEFSGKDSDTLLSFNHDQLKLLERTFDRFDEFVKITKAMKKFNAGNTIGFKEIIFHGPATIVIWDDETKTVVKCTEGDEMNPEMGVAMCTLKKIFGDTVYSRYKKIVKKWVPEKEEDPDERNARAFIDAVKAFSKKIEEEQK